MHLETAILPSRDLGGGASSGGGLVSATGVFLGLLPGGGDEVELGAAAAVLAGSAEDAAATAFGPSERAGTAVGAGLSFLPDADPPRHNLGVHSAPPETTARTSFERAQYADSGFESGQVLVRGPQTGLVVLLQLGTQRALEGADRLAAEAYPPAHHPEQQPEQHLIRRLQL